LPSSVDPSAGGGRLKAGGKVVVLVVLVVCMFDMQLWSG
jgi:hypothetical protein